MLAGLIIHSLLLYRRWTKVSEEERLKMLIPRGDG
jgi:hypothetical protein